MKTIRSKIALLASAAACLALSSPAEAGPYSLVARYVPANAPAGSADVKPFELVINDDDVIPQQTLTHELSSVVIKVNDDDVSKSTLANLRNFVIYVIPPYGSGPSALSTLANDHNGVVNFQALSDEGKAGRIILDGATLGSDDFVHRVEVRTRAKFSAEYLCAKELGMRKTDGKPVEKWATLIKPFLKFPPPDAAPAPAPASKTAGGAAAKAPAAADLLDPTKVDPTLLEAAALFAKSGLSDSSGGAILYSFCSNIVGQVNWEEIAKQSTPRPAAPGDTRTAAEQASDRHKHELSEKLRVHLSGINGDGVTVQVGADGPGYPENIFVSSHHFFTIANHIRTQITFEERELTDPKPLGRYVDQTSDILLKCSGAHASCDDLLGKYVSVVAEGVDAKGNTVKKTVNLVNDGSRWRLQLSLSEFLYRDITLTTVYNLKDRTLELRRDVVGVENFGLVWSFPVVSEIVSLASASKQYSVNPKDLEFKSSIPISWAFNKSGDDGRHLAITLPWMIGYNPRGAPRLADLVRVFPHMSLVFPVSKDANGGTSGGGVSGEDLGNAQLAFGAGVSVVNSFAFSWGVAADTGANYFFLGVSVPDLVSLIK